MNDQSKKLAETWKRELERMTAALEKSNQQREWDEILGRKRTLPFRYYVQYVLWFLLWPARQILYRYQVRKAKRELQLAMQEVINSAIHTYQQAVKFLDSLPIITNVPDGEPFTDPLLPASRLPE